MPNHKQHIPKGAEEQDQEVLSDDWHWSDEAVDVVALLLCVWQLDDRKQLLLALSPENALRQFPEKFLEDGRNCVYREVVCGKD